MKSLVQKLVLLLVAVAIALPLAAQDKEKKKKKGGGEPGAVQAVKKALGKVTLKEDQQKKVDELIAQYTPKLREAQRDAGEAPRKMNEAKKKLKDEGTKGTPAAVKEAAKLTAEEQAAYDKLDALNREFRQAVAAVLTDDQKEQAGLTKGKRKKKNAA